MPASVHIRIHLSSATSYLAQVKNVKTYIGGGACAKMVFDVEYAKEPWGERVGGSAGEKCKLGGGGNLGCSGFLLGLFWFPKRRKTRTAPVTPPVYLFLFAAGAQGKSQCEGSRGGRRMHIVG